MAVNYLTDVLQDETEFAAFISVLRLEVIKSYLEIGSRWGGSLWRAGTGLPSPLRMVAVDMPLGTEESLKDCAKALRDMGHDVNVVLGDSTSDDVIEQVRARGPYDAVFIDANHALPYVTKDWENYGSMGRIVAFHDIAWRRAPEWRGTRIDVPQFWESIKGDYRHEEFKFCPSGKNNGIGVLWR